MKLNWRGVLMFAIALACATTALVAAGLAEEPTGPAESSALASR